MEAGILLSSADDIDFMILEYSMYQVYLRSVALGFSFP